MITGDHRELREALGYYVLGRLAVDEAVQVRAHLDGCPACRSQLAELQPLTQRLAGVQPDRLDATPTPPAALGETVMSRISWERRQQTQSRRPPVRRIALLVAPAVTAIAIGTGIGWVAKPAPAPPSSIAVALERRPDVGVEGTAELIDHTWARGRPARVGSRCRQQLSGRGGRTRRRPVDRRRLRRHRAQPDGVPAQLGGAHG